MTCNPAAHAARTICICAGLFAGGLAALWLPPLVHRLGAAPEGAYWARLEVENLHKALKCAGRHFCFLGNPSTNASRLWDVYRQSGFCPSLPTLTN